jgi:hypothetical protein
MLLREPHICLKCSCPIADPAEEEPVPQLRRPRYQHCTDEQCADALRRHETTGHANNRDPVAYIDMPTNDEPVVP